MGTSSANSIGMGQPSATEIDTGLTAVDGSSTNGTGRTFAAAILDGSRIPWITSGTTPALVSRTNSAGERSNCVLEKRIESRMTAVGTLPSVICTMASLFKAPAGVGAAGAGNAGATAAEGVAAPAGAGAWVLCLATNPAPAGSTT